MTTRAAWALGAPPSERAISRSSRERAASCAVTRRAVGNKTGERRAERRRRAVPLQKFRDRPIAEDEVREQDRRDLDEILELLLDQRHLVGADHRHAGQREFESHRARSGEAGARSPEGGVFCLLAKHDFRRLGPSRRERAHLTLDVRQRRQNSGEAADRLPQRLERAAKVGHQPVDFGAARPGQHDDERRRRGAAARFVGIGPQGLEPLDQRVPDVDASRAIQPAVGLGLERQ